MPNEMTPLEAAERLKKVYDESLTSDWKPNVYDQNALRYSASTMRQISAGELIPVIHAHWNYTSSPNEDCMGGTHDVIECSHCKEDYGAEYDYCPSCGALMDESDMRQTQGGKDDRNA